MQNLLTYLIVAIAVAIALYKMGSGLKSSNQGCNGCASDCGGCDLVDLKKQIEENKKKKNSNIL